MIPHFIIQGVGIFLRSPRQRLLTLELSLKRSTDSEFIQWEESMPLDPRPSDGLEEYGALSIRYSLSRCKGVHFLFNLLL